MTGTFIPRGGIWDSTRTRITSAALSVLAALCLLTAFAALVPQEARAATTTVSISGVYHQSDARSIKAMINSLRTGSDAWYWNQSDTKKVRCGKLSKLSYDYELEKVAMQRAMEIAVRFDHQRPDGSDTWTAYGSYSGYRGENIAIGFSSAASVNTAWTEANEKYAGQGHRRNMLNENFKYVGIACVEVKGVRCWVEEFGSVQKSGTVTNALNGKGTRSVAIKDPSFGVALSSSASVSLEQDSTGKESAALPSATAYVKRSGIWSGLGYVPISGSVTWSSSNSSVAKISGSKVVAVAPGRCALTASSGKGKASVSVIVAAHSHSWGVWKTTTSATCTAPGIQTRTCSKNASHVETREAAAL